MSGNSCSQSKTKSTSLPRQGRPLPELAVRPGQALPTGFWPTVGAGLSLTNCFLQTGQPSTNMLPCNSARWRLARPDLMWRPSMFWLMTKLALPSSISALRAMWEGVGTASFQSTLTSGRSPLRSSVHTPRGPRKSGIPADVLKRYF